MEHYKLMRRERELEEELRDLGSDVKYGKATAETEDRIEEVERELASLSRELDDCEG